MGDLVDKLEDAAHLHATPKRYVLFQDETPFESVPELLTGLDIRTPSRLHLARLQYDTASDFIKRFITALSHQEGEGSIMDAWWDDDELVVISPSFERLRVPLSKLPKVRNIDQDQREKFVIDPYGAFIFWADVDVHVGWSQFKQMVDPEALLRAQQKSNTFNKRYGLAIRKLRQEKGINQSQIEGLDARTIRRIENGETRATSKALACLAQAHQMNTNDYMNRVAKHMQN
jgi:hypothetical protein